VTACLSVYIPELQISLQARPLLNLTHLFRSYSAHFEEARFTSN